MTQRFCSQNTLYSSRLWKLMITLVILMNTSCEKRRESSNRPVFQQEETQYILAFILDTSGSFEQMISSNDVAYRFFLQVSDKYFRSRFGSTSDRLLISQLSASQRSTLLDGPPAVLRQKFPHAQAFKKELLSKSDPHGSRIHTALAESLEYLLARPDVQSGNTQLLVIVLSDMLSNSEETDAEVRALNALRKLATLNPRNAVGLYWVDHDQVAHWQNVLQQSGIQNYIVQSEIVTDPVLPSFED